MYVSSAEAVLDLDAHIWRLPHLSLRVDALVISIELFRKVGLVATASFFSFSCFAPKSQNKTNTKQNKNGWQAVVFLDRDDYKSTWLGNKSIYRTRMAIADGGELIVMAPGVTKFGEDPGIDALIRKVRLHSACPCAH